MKDKQTRLAIILVIITILVVVITFIVDNNKKQEKQTEINIVTNYSNFYTVNSCLYRTITYIFSDDTESLLKILNDDYKEKNNINSNNVLSIFPKVESDSTFDSKKMYYEQQSNNIIKYYVSGIIMKNQIYDEELLPQDDLSNMVYFIVYMDQENKIFSVEPYDGEIFIGGVDNEK